MNINLYQFTRDDQLIKARTDPSASIQIQAQKPLMSHRLTWFWIFDLVCSSPLPWAYQFTFADLNQRTQSCPFFLDYDTLVDSSIIYIQTINSVVIYFSDITENTEVIWCMQGSVHEMISRKGLFRDNWFQINQHTGEVTGLGVSWPAQTHRWDISGQDQSNSYMYKVVRQRCMLTYVCAGSQQRWDRWWHWWQHLTALLPHCKFHNEITCDQQFISLHT